MKARADARWDLQPSQLLTLTYILHRYDLLLGLHPPPPLSRAPLTFTHRSLMTCRNKHQATITHHAVPSHTAGTDADTAQTTDPPSASS
eukprot:scaffold4859_cov128-Isochrysis_galbana.AAC.6